MSKHEKKNNAIRIYYIFLHVVNISIVLYLIIWKVFFCVCVFDYGFCISAVSRSWHCVVLYILFLNVSCHVCHFIFWEFGGSNLSERWVSLIKSCITSTRNWEHSGSWRKTDKHETYGISGIRKKKKVWIGVRPSCESWHLVVSFSEKEMATHSSILAWRIPWTFSAQFSSVTQLVS